MIIAVKNALNAKITLRLVVPLLFILVIGFAVFAFLFRENTNYSLFVGDTSLASPEFEFGPAPALGDFDFFSDVKEAFLESKADFIEANLSDMVIRVYLKGDMKYEAPILTKGKEGSWWETPAGIYKIETRERSHFSSFGRVYQPWSMSFQGNFFIHGWPYYPDGRPVESSFSGGCIRLSDESAEKIFNLAYAEMPVIVFEKDFASDGFVYRSNPPELNAGAYLVADLNNNYVLLDKNRSEILPIASITKIMTALVAGEYINLETNVAVPTEAIVYTSRPRLKTGEFVSAYDLLFPLLLESSNEAAETFANHVGRERFISLMNKKAKAIGMNETRFVDPSGSGEGNQSTTADLFNFAKYLYNNRSFVLKIASGSLKNSVYGKPSFVNLENFNLFGADSSFVGGKIGKTIAAKETFLGVWSLQISGETRPITIILLGSEDVYSDAGKILTWLKFNYQ
ncbi:MAG: L,D-transpeptidase family protein [Parcubacteria group bacterium]